MRIKGVMPSAVDKTIYALCGERLIFLPGLDGTGISFEPVEALLPPDVQVEIVRYPTDRCLNFDQTIQWACHQIRQDPESVVVAESFSGPVAVALVGKGLIKPKCMVLCATFAKPPRPLLLKLAKFLPLSHLLRLPFPTFLLKHILDGRETSARLLRTLWKKIKVTVPPHILQDRLRLLEHIDVRQWLSSIAIPCLYIQATGDRTIPANCVSDFRKGLSDVSIQQIKGPHFVLQAKPAECLDKIGAFVEKINKKRIYLLNK